MRRTILILFITNCSLLIPFLPTGTVHSQSNWTLQNPMPHGQGFYEDMTNSFFFNPQTGYVTGKSGRLLRTTNAGAEWSPLNMGFNNDFYGVYFTDYNTGYVTGTSGLIITTTNSGLSWRQQNSGMTSIVFSIFFVNSNTGYAGGQGRVAYTGDAGNNWVTQILPASGNVNDIYFVNAETGFVASGSGCILRTTNSGNSWTTVFSWQTGSITEIDFGDENTGYAVGFRNVIKTTDGGKTWTQSPIIDSYADISCVDFVNSNTGFISGLSNPSYDVMVCRTTDGGVNWTPEFPGLQLNTLSISAVNEDICFITGYGGSIARRTSVLTSTNSNENGTPARFVLHQNYPNPFNPATKITFDLPSNSTLSGAKGLSAKLIVYDILGRDVATLVNGELRPGSYEIEWDASNVPSGVYFYKLTAGDFTETRRMILIR